MNFKKKMSVALAAAVCCSMISSFSIAATAQEYNYSEESCIVSEMYASDPAYTEAVKLAGLKFNSGLAKKVQSYDGKSSKSAVTYSKSRTKRFFDKLYKNASKMSEDPSKASMSVTLVSKDQVVSMAVKGNKSKTVMYMDVDGSSIGMALYQDAETAYLLDISTKEMISYESESEEDLSSAVVSTAEDAADLGIKDSQKGKLFKFKYKDKGYYYEVFETSDGSTIGCVFDTKLNLVMMVEDSIIYSVKITTSVKSSDLAVPDDYEEMDLSSYGY